MQIHGAALLAKTWSILSYEMCTVLCNLGGYCTDNFCCPCYRSFEFCHQVFPAGIYEKKPTRN